MGLRDFIQVDNQRAFEVGYLSKGIGKFRVRRQRKWVRGGHTSMSTTLKRRGGVTSWLIATGTPSVRRCAKASKEKTGESHTMPTKK